MESERDYKTSLENVFLQMLQCAMMKQRDVRSQNVFLQMLQCETMKERERVRLANVFLQMFPYVALLVFQEFWIPMLHMH